MEIVLLIIVVVLILSVLAYKSLLKDKAQKKELYEQLELQPEVINGLVLVKKSLYGFLSGIAISPDNIYLYRSGVISPIHRSDLLYAEIVANEKTISKTSRSSQLAGVTVGGLLGGRTGAVIGGLSGSTVTKQAPPDSVVLRLTINDEITPLYNIDFIESTASGKTHGFIAINEAEIWLARLNVVIHKNNNQT